MPSCVTVSGVVSLSVTVTTDSVMTKQERIAKRDAEIDGMIDKYDMERKCSMSRAAIHKSVERAMVLNNLAFVLADAANTFLMDCESELGRFGVCFGQQDKYNFRQMLSHLNAAKKWAQKSALPIYGISDADDACADSDWWYSLLKLIDDRLGDDPRKTNMFLEYLLNMPSEVGLFKVTYDDFKRFKKDTV